MSIDATIATIATLTNTQIIIVAIPEFYSLALRGTRSKKVHIHSPDFGGFSLCGLEGLISGCIINAIDGNPNNHFTYVEYDSENKALVPVDDCLNHAEDMAAKLKLCQVCVKVLIVELLEGLEEDGKITPEKKEELLKQLFGNTNGNGYHYHQGMDEEEEEEAPEKKGRLLMQFIEYTSANGNGNGNG